MHNTEQRESRNPTCDLPRLGAVKLLDEMPAIVQALLKTRIFILSGKRRNSTFGQQWEDNYLYSGQLSILSSTSKSTLLDPVTTRSDKHACGKPMLTDHNKQATKNLEPANEMNKEGPTQRSPVCLQPFTEFLRTWRRVCSHILLKERTQIRKV